MPPLNLCPLQLVSQNIFWQKLIARHFPTCWLLMNFGFICFWEWLQLKRTFSNIYPIYCWWTWYLKFRVFLGFISFLFQYLDSSKQIQTLQEVNVNVPVPNGTKSRLVICEIKKNHLKVGLKGQLPIIEVSLPCLTTTLAVFLIDNIMCLS